MLKWLEWTYHTTGPISDIPIRSSADKNLSYTTTKDTKGLVKFSLYVPLLALQAVNQVLPVLRILEIRCQWLGHGKTRNTFRAYKGKIGDRLGPNNYYWVPQNVFFFSMLHHKNRDTCLSSNNHKIIIFRTTDSKTCD